MIYDPDKHHRHSIRLKNYDYASAGIYFVTICTQHRELFFGNVVNNEMQLDEAGQMIQTAWQELPQWFLAIELDEFAVMPNHFHGLLVITESNGVQEDKVGDLSAVALISPVEVSTSDAIEDNTKDNLSPKSALRLGDIIGAFKSVTTHKYIQGVRQADWPPFDRRLWQRNYWEHIVRNEVSLNEIRKYIRTNEKSWLNDQLYPDAPPNKFNQP